MDSPPSAGERGEDYEKLLSIALEQKPNFELDPTTFVIAILAHDKDVTNCQSTDFVWLKVKAKHSISKLKLHYQKKLGVSVEFRFGNYSPSDATHVRHLVASNAEYPILTTHSVGLEVGGNQAKTSNTPSSSNRTPLHTRNSHLSASPAPMRDVKPIIKSDPGRAVTPAVQLSQVPVTTPRRVKNERSASPGLMSPSFPTRSRHVDVKSEPRQEDIPLDPQAVKKAQSERLSKLMEEGTPEQLESEVRDMQILLAAMKEPIAPMSSEMQDAKHWLTQIDNLLKHRVDTPTVIGVVGNTGAGKSSVINAVLEEERLVPTNCMRACTAVVTEMSYNYSDKPTARYRAEIEFIKPADWEKDVRLSFSELLDSGGQISRECSNEESEAGIAYAKLKSVYPQKTKEMLVDCTVEQLMKDPAVKKVLGTTMTIERSKSDLFYKALQNIIDSKEKKKGEKKEMEYWPLIKVVKLYTKADALSTGAVIVDLPGVHDSNAARAAVAQGYMKQCTGLFIVAPINRAVDDKAAKNLLGESFKRQLKYDGFFSRVTMICSKSDDISITEASDSLGLEDEVGADWTRIEEIEKETRDLKTSIKDLKESRGVYSELINDCDDQIEKWEELKAKVEDGEEIWATETSKKRKRASRPKKSRKKSRKSNAKDSDDEDDFIDDDDEDEEDEEEASGSESEQEPDLEEPLTVDYIDEKLSKFKEDKKRARTERTEIDTKLKPINQEIAALNVTKAKIEAQVSAVCIKGRNEYSRGAIQRDFADGIRELDMENAQEEDPDQFDPETQLRDYDEVAKSLKVFCVSSRAYQKLSGRLLKDAKVSGFRTVEETEIPQLQAHCKKLTEGGRAANCRAFLTRFNQLLNSLSLWASDDGSGINLSDAQLKQETRFLKTRLNTLEKTLQTSVKSSLHEISQALAEHLYENFEGVVDMAAREAPQTCRKWHRPLNRDDRAAGGYHWGTYKAIMRREGVYTNPWGAHDFNAALAEPIMKNLTGHWERVFAQRLPRVLQSFTTQSKVHLTSFHREVEVRSTNLGLGVAGLGLLSENLRNYEAIFVTLAGQMIDLINEHQREANREFTPVIAHKLQSAYIYCAEEYGSGSFKRMKAHMEDHVDSNREDMFCESVDEVKKLLDLMCEQVDTSMLDRTDDVYQAMSRDYLSVMGGSKLPDGQVMPRWERMLRSDVLQVIEGRENIVSKVKREKQKAAEAKAEQLAEEERLKVERAAANEKREKEEAQVAKKKKFDETKAAKKKAAEEKAAKKKAEDSETNRGSAKVVESSKANAEEDNDIMELS